MSNEKYTPQFQDNETINIRAELEKYLIHWKWFALGVIIALLGAYLYLRYSTPRYNASATILIKNDKNLLIKPLSPIICNKVANLSSTL